MSACVSIPVKRAIGGRVVSAADTELTVRELERGTSLVEDHLEPLEDFQFHDLCQSLQHVETAPELAAALGVSADNRAGSHRPEGTGETTDRPVGTGPTAETWLAWANDDNVDAAGVLFCMANRWVQQPPDRETQEGQEEAFRVAEVLDHLGHPYAASALRDEFSDRPDE